MPSTMRLMIMRHGTADDVSPSGLDADRALTVKGRERVREVARRLVQSSFIPGLRYSSPLIRALQTAEEVEAIVRGARGASTPLEVCDDLLPDGDASGLAWRLSESGTSAAMFFGHEPQLTDLVGKLLDAPSPVSMQKAMVVGLDLTAGARAASLVFVLDPKTLSFSHRAG